MHTIILDGHRTFITSDDLTYIRTIAAMLTSDGYTVTIEAA